MTELPKKDPIKDSNITVRLDHKLADKIRRKAKEKGYTISQVVEYGFKKFLEDVDKKPRR